MTGLLVRVALRKLAVALRDRGLSVAFVIQLAVLAGAVLFRCEEALIEGGAGARQALFGRLLEPLWVCVVALAPWTVLRIVEDDGGDVLQRRVAALGVGPAAVVGAEMAGILTYLCLLPIAATPILAFGWHIGEVAAVVALHAGLRIVGLMSLLTLSLYPIVTARGEPLALLGHAYLATLALVAGLGAAWVRDGSTPVAFVAVVFVIAAGLCLHRVEALRWSSE